jgi:hypothetical protein
LEVPGVYFNDSSDFVVNFRDISIFSQISIAIKTYHTESESERVRVRGNKWKKKKWMVSWTLHSALSHSTINLWATRRNDSSRCLMSCADLIDLSLLLSVFFFFILYFIFILCMSVINNHQFSVMAAVFFVLLSRIFILSFYSHSFNDHNVPFILILSDTLRGNRSIVKSNLWHN